jgi:hypothetical protein
MATERVMSRVELKTALVLIAVQLGLHFFVIEGLRDAHDKLIERAAAAAEMKLLDTSYGLRADAAALQEFIDGIANLAIALSIAALVLLGIGWVRNRRSWKAREAQWVQEVIEAGGDVRGDLKTRLKRSWAVQTAVEKWSVVGVLVALVQLADGLASRYL